MQIRYTATPQDVGALLRYSLRHSPRLWVRLGALVLLPAAVSAVLAAASGGRVTRADLVPGLVFGVLAAVAVPTIVRLRTKRDERVLTIGAAGIQTAVGQLSGAVTWARIASVAETPEHIFITGTSGNGFAVPSRAFATPAERGEFLARIAEYRRAAI